MGAWGLSSFENDDALDWVIDLESTSDMTILEETLSLVINSEEDYLDASECSMALAAAEVVAALGGMPPAELPDEVVQWVKGKGKPDSSLVSKAKQAIQAILDGSELKELWEETDEFDLWVADVKGILARLG
jgi:hypothetical protein